MIISQYTKLTKSPSGKCIVDTVDVKDYVELADGNAKQVVITYFLVVEQDEWQAFCKEQETRQNANERQEADKKLQEACETILTTDPFGKRFSGYKLIDIFRADFLWVEQALKEMKNKYIVDRLKLIKEAIDNGKINI